MNENAYALSDKAITLLNKKAVRRFEDARRKCGLLKFDELNVIKVCKDLYASLASDNYRTFLDLAGLVYVGAMPHGEKKPDEKWLDKVLAAYDETALWIYIHEVNRKCDYTTEAVNASRDKKKEFHRGLKHWSKMMIAHECDRITDEAVLKAFRDAGVKRVRWKTAGDEKVCETCGPRDGKVYDIDKVPPKPHVNCRCFLEAVKK